TRRRIRSWSAPDRRDQRVELLLDPIEFVLRVVRPLLRLRERLLVLDHVRPREVVRERPVLHLGDDHVHHSSQRRLRHFARLRALPVTVRERVLLRGPLQDIQVIQGVRLLLGPHLLRLLHALSVAALHRAAATRNRRPHPHGKVSIVYFIPASISRIFLELSIRSAYLDTTHFGSGLMPSWSSQRITGRHLAIVSLPPSMTPSSAPSTSNLTQSTRSNSNSSSFATSTS